MKLEVINPITGKGIDGRKFKGKSNAKAVLDSESNYIEIGVIARNDAGEAVKDATVTVTATDATQNKTMAGTGTLATIHEGEIKKVVPYYHYHYEFNQPGKHEILFECEKTQEKVKLDVEA